MLGPGSPTRTFAPARPAADGAAAYSRAEFRDGSSEWLLADAAIAEKGRAAADSARRSPGRRGLARWLAWASAAASKFAGVFL